MENFKLPLDMVLESLLCGILLSLVYFSLLWYSLKVLPNMKRKGLFLFVTSLIRLVIFLTVAILLAKDGHMKLIWMVLAFIVTRLCLVKFLKNRGQHA
jgi:F1F0 ATPase subunit 2